jgi:fatty-acyl-CoA synthase
VLIMSNPNALTLGWTVSSILGDFAPQAFHDTDKTALIWEDGSRTYGELRDRARRLATGFRAMGLETGDRVATLLFNRGEIFEVYFACAYAGLTFVPVSFRLTASEISSILLDCEAKLVLTEPELNGTLTHALQDLSLRPKIILLQPTTGGAEFASLATECLPIAVPVANDIQMILYTSGTTGRPKGAVMRSTAIVWCAMQQITQFRQLDRRSVMLLNAPMYNTAAMNESSIPTFFAGGTVAIMPSRGWSAEKLAGCIETWQVTHSLIFPSMFRSLIEADERSPLPLRSLKWWYTGGENCPPALMAEVRRRWPKIHLAIAYGSTESGMVTIIEDDDIERYPGSVGRCVPGQTIRLLDRDGSDVARGEVGEVWTAGPAVMRNYWNAPELDAETVRDGWLKIGDLARMDEDGHYYIVGRSKDLIISKGQNIYPAEVENVIRQHLSVLDVAVVGIPDAEFGEAVCAAIVLRDRHEATEAQMLAFIRTKLASYKKPRHMFFLDRLPIKNATKVDKQALARTCLDLANAKLGGC